MQAFHYKFYAVAYKVKCDFSPNNEEFKEYL